jgi:hypothetical protein
MMGAFLRFLFLIYYLEHVTAILEKFLMKILMGKCEGGIPQPLKIIESLYMQLTQQYHRFKYLNNLLHPSASCIEKPQRKNRHEMETLGKSKKSIHAKNTGKFWEENEA